MDFKENTAPIYLQICDTVCDNILSGAWPPGGRVPSVREYSATLMVNINTLVRSYGQLEQRGILANRRGVGYFVADDAADRIRAMRLEAFLGGEMQQLFRRLSLSGITPAQLAQLYDDYLQSTKQ